MARYSHSKIVSFEQCPYQFKLRYIDKLKPEVPENIEGFMGRMVHEALEELYKRKELKEISAQDIIEFYNTAWRGNYTPQILLNNGFKSVDDYRFVGERFIRDYFEKYYPFNQHEILGLETDDIMILPDGNEWYVRIDRFARDQEGNYYVCDYKTSSRMKEKWEIEEDKQLAMYSIWVRRNFPDVKSVKLVWNMLAFNSEIVSERSDEELNSLMEEMMIKIAKIENAKEYPAKVSKLCYYCGYQKQCQYFIEAKRKGEI